MRRMRPPLCQRPQGPLASAARDPSPCRRANGFSLLEALTAMAVTAICLVLGVPSFQSLSERSRVDSAMYLLTAYAASARSTAISYRIPTVVCPSNGNGGCRADGDWSQGWLMFFDKDGNRRPDSPADILREENAHLHPSLRVVTSAGRHTLRYLPDGRSTGSNLRLRVCRGDRLMGAVVISNTGRIRSERPPKPEPC